MKKHLMKLADAGIGVILCRVLGKFSFLLSKDREPPEADLDTVRRILVIRPGGVGDMIVLLPVLEALRRRFPGTSIDLVCERRNVAVLALSGIQDSAMVYDANPFRFLWRLRHGEYDVAVDTEQFHNFSAVFAWLSGAPVRIGFKINPHRNPLYTHLVDYRMDGPEGEQFLRLLQPLGVGNEPYGPAGTLANARLSAPPEGAPGQAPQPTAPFIAIHPGSSSAYKLWPADRFTELAVQLADRYGVDILLLGDRPDRERNAGIREAAARAGCRRVTCADTLELRGAAGLIMRARLFIGTDSGLSHLATALGQRTVVLFGPSDHAKWGFQDSTHAVVRKDLPCAPCFIFGYHKPCRSIACMRRIAVKDVLDACADVLSDE